jgi:PAS domain S-box-containing protein
MEIPPRPESLLSPSGELQSAKPWYGDRLLTAIIAFPAGMVVFILISYRFWGSGPVLASAPWYLPLVSAFTALTALSLAYLALGRYTLLHQPLSYWIGLGFAGYGVGQLFVVLTWPGLLPGGGSILGRLANTPSAIGVVSQTVLDVSLLAAVLARWPGERSRPASRWLGLAAWLLGMLAVFSLLIIFEGSLPTLVKADGSFTPLLRTWTTIQLFGFAAGSLLSARYYRRSGDQLAGFLAIPQIALVFVSLMLLIGGKRYDLWWYFQRMLQTGGFLSLLFGLLSEYMQLFRRERDQSRLLQARSAEFSGVLENSPNAIFVTDEAGQVSFANQAALELLGVASPKDLSGPVSGWASPLEARDPQGQLVSENEISLERVGRGEAFRNEEYQFQDAAGHTTRWVLNSGAPLTDPAGQRIGGIMVSTDITQRKQVEAEREALLVENRRQKALLEAMFDADPGGLAVLSGPQMRIVYANPAYRYLIPNIALDPVGQPYDTVWPPDQGNGYHEQVRQVLESGRPFQTGTFERIYPDGDRREITFQARRLDWDDGPACLLILWDVTDVKKTERMLRQREDELRANQELLTNIIDSSPEIIYARDLDGRLILLNDTLARVYGIPKEKALGTTDDDIYERETAERVRGWDRKVLSQGAAIQYEETIPVRGMPHTYITTKFPLRDAQGKIYGVGGVNADITDRKQSEEKLRESEETLRVTFEQAAIGIARVSPQGRQLWVNDKFCQITGYSLEEVMALSLEDLTYSGDLGIEQHLIDQVLSGERASYGLEKRYIRKDGALIWVNLTASLVRDPSGAPLFFIKIIEDISDRKAAETMLAIRNNEIHAMTEQLWQTAKLATMGELAASVAHELNNPLAILSLRAENLGISLPENSPEHADLTVMEEEIDRMAELVSNLLQFSRSGQRQLSSLDLTSEIDRTLELLRSYLLHRKIGVVEDLSPDAPLVQADRQQMRQLFLNLFTNASDAMPAGGTLTIRVQPTSDEAQVVIEVQDSGIGIAPQNLPHLMEPFFTTKPEGKGTGLGLAICRRIVEEHNGTLQISSPGENQGATIRMTLPVRKGDRSQSLLE